MGCVGLVACLHMGPSFRCHKISYSKIKAGLVNERATTLKNRLQIRKYLKLKKLGSKEICSLFAEFLFPHRCHVSHVLDAARRKSELV